MPHRNANVKDHGQVIGRVIQDKPTMPRLSRRSFVYQLTTAIAPMRDNYNNNDSENEDDEDDDSNDDDDDNDTVEVSSSTTKDED